VSELPRANVRVFRIVAGAWLVGWFCKAPFFAAYYLWEIWAYPIRYAELPRILVHPALATIAWVAPALALAALAYPRTWTLRAAAALMTTAALVGCIHFETFNDATYVTSFWVGLWLVWFTANARRTDAPLYLHARVLAQCIVAIVFLGGVVGKLSGAYFTGDAFYHLYFLQKGNWPYPALRETVAPETLHAIARWFSRAAIGVELLVTLSPLVPFRIAAIGGIVVMLAMVVISTWYLLSVMACLIGLLLALLLLRE
jgi:hypothetical protein